MKVWRNPQEGNALPSAVALGMFDGVHLGHQAVIGAAKNTADALQTVVLTFTTKHGRPTKKAHQKDILTAEGRLKRLETLGIDAVYMPDFEEIRSLEPEEFVRQILHDTLHAKILCCGDDFRFGKQARGDVALLQKLGRMLDMQVVVVPPKLDGGQPISSTRIRQCLLDGDIVSANRMLGYRYFIEGKVVYGRQLGRTMDCPTINQELSEHICIPKYGVYISATEVDGVLYPSITNVGKKPTIAGERQPLAETHLIGLDQNLYGRVLRVTLYDFIREEAKFESVEALFRRIHRDIETAKMYFNK